MSRHRCISNSRLKRSDSAAGSRNESGSEFQTVGPATEDRPISATEPSVQSWTSSLEQSFDESQIAGLVLEPFQTAAEDFIWWVEPEHSVNPP